MAPPPLQQARLILLTRLLRLTGRVRVAARLQRIVLRHMPMRPSLFRLQFLTLLQAGHPPEARRLLAATAPEPNLRSPAWQEAVAQAWPIWTSLNAPAGWPR